MKIASSSWITTWKGCVTKIAADDMHIDACLHGSTTSWSPGRRNSAEVTRQWCVFRRQLAWSLLRHQPQQNIKINKRRPREWGKDHSIPPSVYSTRKWCCRSDHLGRGSGRYSKLTKRAPTGEAQDSATHWHSLPFKTFFVYPYLIREGRVNIGRGL